MTKIDDSRRIVVVKIWDDGQRARRRWDGGKELRGLVSEL
jgi:hypothetical protein